MSINAYTDEELGALLRQQFERVSVNDQTEQMGTATAQLRLPKEIREDLDATPDETRNANITSFANDLPEYEGGSWTKSGQLNKIFHQQVKQHKLDALSVINSKYRDGNRLRIVGRAATEAYNILSTILEQRDDADDPEENLRQLLERIRRLAVYSFATGKAMDHDARAISNRALGIYNAENDNAQKEMAYSTEEVTAWQENKFRQQIIRANVAARNTQFRNNHHRGRGTYQRYNKKPFFGKRQHNRYRNDDQSTTIPNSDRN
ncbi:hypothetical protein BJV82DRAFT_517334 [Fennellomyces sp. T-0311]|nr:hypothetical protein BJV82DRAFT_517334 [Fennellomyces sp. T-0311]